MTHFRKSYNWETWYKYTKQGAAAINRANPDLLIFISGMDGDTTVQPIVQGTALTPGIGTFELSDFEGYANKLVLEIHNYEGYITDCPAYKETLYNRGFKALDPTSEHRFPVMMTEFGFDNDNATTWMAFYASCLREYLPEIGAGWMIWPLSGNYYIREGTQDSDDSWGLVSHDWSDWRNPAHIEGGLKPMINATYGFFGMIASIGDCTAVGNGSTENNGTATVPPKSDVKSVYAFGVPLSGLLAGYALLSCFMFSL